MRHISLIIITQINDPTDFGESMASVKKKRRAKIAKHKRKKRRRRDRHKKS